jgi:glycosyltransferase involved in cell wall biosynthesis
MSDHIMRIIHILPTRAKEYGGPISVAEAMAEEANKKGLECSVYPPIKLQKFPFGLIYLYREIKKADIVHMHGLWNINCTLAAFLSQAFNKPYIVTPHGMLDKWALRQSKFKKWIYGHLIEMRNLRLAATLHFLNDEEKNEAGGYGVNFRNSLVLPNGIDPALYKFLPDKSILTDKHPEIKNKITALYLGRLHPKKGCNLIIPALAEVLKSNPNIHLLIAGPDQNGYQSKLLEQVKMLNLISNVTFLGMVSGVYKLQVFSSADFFILPSHQEGDSIAVKEAMACGLPVIITPACHFNEVKSLNCGIIINPITNEIAQAMIRLSGNSNLRKILGENGKMLISSKYTWSILTKKLHDKYIDLKNN